MRYSPRLALLVGVAFLSVAVPSSATPTQTSLFNECPHVGQSVGCSYLIEFGSHGSVTFLSDSSVKDVDAKDDILIGILNNSGTYVNLSGYTGPNNVFSSLHLTGGLWNGKSTYFEMDDPFENETNDDHDDDDSHVTPEPSSILLLGTGLVAAGGFLRRLLGNNRQSQLP